MNPKALPPIPAPEQNINVAPQPSTAESLSCAFAAASSSEDVGQGEVACAAPIPPVPLVTRRTSRFSEPELVCEKCRGAGRIFLAATVHGRLYEPCACALGDEAREYCAQDKSRLHAADEEAERRDAQRSLA